MDADHLPNELIEGIAKRNCVLWVGSDWPLGFIEGMAPPCRSELAILLASELADKQLISDLPSIARDYELDFGRQRLVQVILNCTQRPAYKVPELYQLATVLPFAAYVTTSYDELLEQALHSAGQSIMKVVKDLEATYEQPGQTLVLKLYGCVSQPESLVVTEDDQINLGRRLKQVLDRVRLLFVAHPLLFIGHNPSDRYLKELYAEATFGLSEHARRAYIVWSNTEHSVARYWERKNVQILDFAPEKFLERLRKERHRYPNRQIPTKGSLKIERPPYKFLDFYESHDQDIFCGREAESSVLWRFILSEPLTILFGQSGVGKTSLLKAGLMPRLWQMDTRWSIFVHLMIR
jgi:hypothetical protein